MDLFSLGGSRSMVAGVAVSAASAVLPIAFGSNAESAKVDLLDGTAWLSSESAGNVVRVNGETGRVDARLDLGQLAGELLVAQDDGIVLVNLGGEVRSVDLANLDWSAAADADGGMVVGDGAAYMVSPEGVVRSLDPVTLETLGSVDLEATPGQGVVADGRLVLPLDDGTVKVVDGDSVAGSVEAGSAGDALHVTLMGDEVAVLNQSQRTVRRLDASSGDASGREKIDLPSGELLVPTELPAGPLWVAATRSGELAGIDLDGGDTVTAPVAEAQHQLTPPAAAEGRIYMVDRTAAEIVAVDADSLEVVRRESLGIPDASRVELVVEGGKVFVNDRASQLAIVIDGDEFTRVDKYRDDGVARPAPPSDIPNLDPAPASNPAPNPGAPTGPPAPPQPAPPQPPSGPPAPPASVNATPGNASATVSWAPGGGPAATAYHVTYRGGPTIDVPGGQVSTSVDGLNNGDTYVFEVWASNEHGESARVASNEVEPNDEVPGAPSRVEAEDGNASATVSWSEADGRGNDIDHYLVTPSPATVEPMEVRGNSTSTTVEGLTNDTEYTFTVTAVNDLGIAGDPSPPSAPVTPWGPPGEIPGTVTVTQGNTTADLDWNDAPSANEPATYRITASPAVGGQTEFTTEATDRHFEGLVNGTTYTFTIVPQNSRGAGPPKTATASPGGPPAVTGVTASMVGDRRAEVTFDVDTGGRQITGCTIASSAGQNANCNAESGSGQIDLPQYATSYTFTVTVTNELGDNSGTSGAVSTAKKALVVDADADRWDGATCTWQGHENTRPYFGSSTYGCDREQGYIANRTTVHARCWETGSTIGDDYQLDDPANHQSNRWIRVDQGFMNSLYFTTWNSNPESGLPSC